MRSEADLTRGPSAAPDLPAQVSPPGVEQPKLSSDDVAYVRREFAPLQDICWAHGEDVSEVRALIESRVLPRPSYTLPDGTEMVPRDYFSLVDAAGGSSDLKHYFAEHYRGSTLSEDWDAYLDGIYGVCLRTVTPEAIVRKGELVVTIEQLLEQQRPDDQLWARQLRESVNELDALERPFSPHYDRTAYGRLPTRDLLVTYPRLRFPDVFAASVD